MKKIVYILGILLVYATITYGQGISMTIGTQTSEVGDTVTVPVDVANFNNIGAVSLKMQYAASVLEYIGISNGPSAGNLTQNASGGVLTIGWFNTTPLNLGNGKFLDIKFVYKGGTSDIAFQVANCEIANSNGTILVVEYNNGKVSAAEGAESTIRLPEVKAVAGNQVTVPLVFENFQNLGAVSLKINYDTNVLTYNGVSDQPSAGNFTANAANGVLTIGWFDTTPLNIDSAKFIDIKFIYNGGTSNLSFNTPQCEVSSTSGSNIVVNYVNGNIIPDPSSILSISLADVTAASGTDVTVPVTLNNFSNIGAISLKIQYDQNVLDFKSVENSLTSGNFSSNGGNGVVTIGWFDTNPINAASLKLADIKFTYKSGTSNLTFDATQCEVATVGGVVETVTYVGGSVSATPGSQATVIAGTVKGTIGEDVTVPFTVENFTNIGAVSFKINYDPAVLVYKGIENQPSAGNFTANAANGVLTLGWFNTTALEVSNGKLVDVKFGYLGGNSNLTFNVAQCEVSNLSGGAVTVTYQNGLVSPLSEPVFTIPDLKGVAGQSITFPVIAQKLANIGAISLKVNYDQTVLTYTGVQNAPAEGNFTANANNGVLTLGWFNTTAINSDSLKFVDVKFTYNGGNSNLDFVVNECEISNLSGTVINASYVNGSVMPELSSSPKLTIANIASSVGQTVTVPVTAENLTEVGAVSLKIQYNTSVLTYVGFEGQPAAGNFTANAQNGTVTLGWFNTSPIVLTEGNLVKLRFTYNGGNTPVGFVTTECELAKIDGSVITFVEYVNGSVQGNMPPVFTAELADTVRIAEGDSLSFKYEATDANPGSVLVYSLIAPPTGASIDAATGLFQWVPNYEQAGNYVVKAVVTDGVLSDTSSVSIVVVDNTNRAPVFTQVPSDTLKTVENTLLSFEFKATDPDTGTTLKYALAVGPKGAKVDTLTGVFTWTPDYTQSGKYNATVVVTDGFLNDTVKVAILVTNTNRPPAFTAVLGDRVLDVTSSGGPKPWTYTYSTLQFQYKAADPDAGTKLTYSLVTEPVAKGLIFYPANGSFRWKPDAATVQAGDYTFLFTVSDGELSVTDTSIVTVPAATDVNDNDSEIPTEYSLMQNFPNPFNPSTKIKYGIPEESRVVLSIYNLLGQRISVLVDEVKPAGTYTAEFNASNLTTGFYIYKIEAKNYTSVKKMILMK